VTLRQIKFVKGGVDIVILLIIVFAACSQWSTGRRCPDGLSGAQRYTRSGCQALCYFNPNCVGIDYNPYFSTCYFELSASNTFNSPSNAAATNCVQYVLTRAC